MNARILCGLILTICAFPNFALVPVVAQEDINPDAELLKIAKTFVESKPIPGVVMAIVEHGKPLKIAAAGVRKRGDETAITIHDKMHLGSCTKAMTSTLIARLVEQGKLKFESTIGEVLPELKTHEKFKAVTIEQLLTHQSGALANAISWWLGSDKSVKQARRKIAELGLQQPPEFEPGTKTLYSNLGYMIAGMMAAKVGGKKWEDLIKQEVFEPMGITSAGFGPPSVDGKLDQPWGHRLSGDTEPPPSQFDNAPALGPAGRVHMSFSDWAKFTLAHATDGKSIPNEQFLKAATWKRLHKPLRDDKAFGWVVIKRQWGKGTVFTHSGSNTTWFCTVWVAPNQDRVYLVGVNAAGGNTGRDVDSLFGKLIAIGNR